MTRKLTGLYLIVIAACAGNPEAPARREPAGSTQTATVSSICDRYSTEPPTIHFGDWEAYHQASFAGRASLREGHYIDRQLDVLEVNCVLRPLLLDWFQSRPETESVSLYGSSLDHDLKELMAESPRAVEIPNAAIVMGGAVVSARDVAGFPSVWDVSARRCISELSASEVSLAPVRDCYILYLLNQESPDSRPMKEHVFYEVESGLHRVQYCELFLNRLGASMVYTDNLPPSDWRSHTHAGAPSP